MAYGELLKLLLVLVLLVQLLFQLVLQNLLLPDLEILFPRTSRFFTLSIPPPSKLIKPLVPPPLSMFHHHLTFPLFHRPRQTLTTLRLNLLIRPQILNHPSRQTRILLLNRIKTPLLRPLLLLWFNKNQEVRR